MISLILRLLSYMLNLVLVLFIWNGMTLADIPERTANVYVCESNQSMSIDEEENHLSQENAASSRFRTVKKLRQRTAGAHHVLPFMEKDLGLTESEEDSLLPSSSFSAVRLQTLFCVYQIWQAHITHFFGIYRNAFGERRRGFSANCIYHYNYLSNKLGSVEI